MDAQLERMGKRQPFNLKHLADRGISRGRLRGQHARHWLLWTEGGGSSTRTRLQLPSSAPTPA